MMSRVKNKWLLKGVTALYMAGMLLAAAPLSVMPVLATEAVYINDDQRADAHAEMKFYMETLIKRENPEQYIKDELGDILYSGIYYIANSEKMKEEEMWAHVAKIKGLMDAAVSKTGETTTTTEFLSLADNWETPTVSYGQKVSIVLPIINMGEEWLTDLLVEPVISNDVNEWPFAPASKPYQKWRRGLPASAFASCTIPRQR